MLRRPYFFCLYKRNRGKKIHSRGRAFYKAALPLENPPPPKNESLSGLTVGQGAPRLLPLPNIRVQAVLPRDAGTSCSAGGVHRGGCMCLREQTLNASPMGRFLAYFFWTSKRSRPPEGVGTYSSSSNS